MKKRDIRLGTIWTDGEMYFCLTKWVPTGHYQVLARTATSGGWFTLFDSAVLREARNYIFNNATREVFYK